MRLQVESAKAASEQATGSREEQDELELPNLRKPARGGGLPLLGQVSPRFCASAEAKQPVLRDRCNGEFEQ